MNHNRAGRLRHLVLCHKLLFGLLLACGGKTTLELGTEESQPRSVESVEVQQDIPSDGPLRTLTK